MRQRVTSGRRLLGVDVARSVALFGMMSVHIFPALRADGSLHPAYVIAAGRSAALFAVLAGVGLALATGGRQRYDGAGLRAARVGVLGRAVLLVALGLLLGRIDSPPLVILAYYGLLFVLAIPFLGLSSRALTALAALSAVLAPVASHLLRMGLDVAPVAEPGGAHVPAELLLTGTYPALPWTTYLFAGLALGRLDLRPARTAVQVLALGVAVAVGAKLASAWLFTAAGGSDRLRGTVPSDPGYAFLRDDLDRFLREGFFGTTPTTDWRWLLIASPHSSTTFDLLHTTGVAAAVLGACLLLVNAVPRWLYLPLAAAGSMTLTLYTAHVLALTNGNPLLRADRFALYWWHVVVALVVATLWRSLIGRGPLEWLAARLDGIGRRAVERRRPPARRSRRVPR